MQHVGEGIEHQIAHFDPQAGHALKIARNNAAFEQAVRQAWADCPDAAEYLLAHVNSLFFAKDETPRKGAAKDVERYVMGVYLDDPMARSELNARREVLMLFLMRAGLRFDELRIIPATMGMRERRLYPHAVKRLAVLFGGEEAPADAWQPSRLSASDVECVASQVEDDQVREALRAAMEACAGRKAPASAAGGPVRAVAYGGGGACLAETEEEALVRRAICLAVADLERAHAFLRGVRSIELSLAKGKGPCPPARRRYWCALHVENPELFAGLFEPYREAVLARARELGLPLSGINLLS